MFIISFLLYLLLLITFQLFIASAKLLTKLEITKRFSLFCCICPQKVKKKWVKDLMDMWILK